MKITEKTVQEISLDAKDLETMEVTFTFRCGNCHSYTRISLNELTREVPMCLYGCKNTKLTDLLALDIKGH
jgi:hypothetical protein